MKNKELSELLKEYAEAHKNSFLSQKVNYEGICERIALIAKDDDYTTKLINGFINEKSTDDLQKAIQFQGLIDYFIFLMSKKI